MRTRVITAVVALAVFIPLLLIGGVPFNVLVFAMGIVGMSEFLIMKKELIVSVEALLSFIGIAVLLAPGQCAGFLPKNVTTLDAFYFVMLALLIYTVFSKNSCFFSSFSMQANNSSIASMISSQKTAFKIVCNIFWTSRSSSRNVPHSFAVLITA